MEEDRLPKINILRERFMPYGWFDIIFDSKNNVFSCRYKFEKQEGEPLNFLKSSYEDILYELEIVISMYVSKYIPGYVR